MSLLLDNDNLCRGVTPNVWGAGSAWGLYFLFYNSLKSWWQGGDSKTNLGPTKHMIIATEAGFLTLVSLAHSFNKDRK